MIGNSVQAVVLAAGRSQRFHAPYPKQLAPLCGQPLIVYPLRTLAECSIPTTLVVGPEHSGIERAISDARLAEISYVTQHEPRGTGDALASSRPLWHAEHILVLNGDVPLITRGEIQSLLDDHCASQATLSFLVSTVDDPTGYGRVIIRDGALTIVEQRDCSIDEARVRLINAGVYLIETHFLRDHIDSLAPHNNSHERYITDLIRIAVDKHLAVQPIDAAYNRVRGVNTLEELSIVQEIKRQDIIARWMTRGVRFEQPMISYVEDDVVIGEGTFIGAGARLYAGTTLGERVHVGPYAILERARIGSDVRVLAHSMIQDSELASGASVGPFAWIHARSFVGEGTVIGNFVEVSKSTLGEHTKAKHLTYLGNAIVGDRCNIGAGTITCNYDGARKHTTHIGNNVFIGTNNSLVAPLTISDGAYTAAGSTITQEVPADSLAIARAPQCNKPGYATKLREGV